jgi:hypothetical protein
MKSMIITLFVQNIFSKRWRLSGIPGTPLRPPGGRHLSITARKWHQKASSWGVPNAKVVALEETNEMAYIFDVRKDVCGHLRDATCLATLSTIACSMWRPKKLQNPNATLNNSMWHQKK